ncbi:response regulator transcription factor [Geobacter sp. FeAm09]|uniref:response regulator transcription factor n=1 Tax=Geobacter sp. FeAm09 TaxID=2597769 RepID=UPI0011EC7314|nr:response regulator transcription factor [Geobacter sp. FeAm09]QEM69564.1 response regulator transcription factor [Geobacter sp. FeAm09]
MRHEKTNPRIILVDDHPAVRQGVALLLAQEGVAVCCEAENRAGTLEVLDGCRADVALVDLSLGDESGLDLVGDMKRRGIAVVIYSMHEDTGSIERAFAAGVNGYVTKRDLASDLIRAVRDVLDGRRHISPRAAQSLARKLVSDPAGVQDECLSERERQVLSLISQGDATVDIATTLAVSTRTVETYYARIMEKLHLDGMKALRRYALRNVEQVAEKSVHGVAGTRGLG